MKFTTDELRQQAARTPDWNAQAMLNWAADVIDAARAMADENAKQPPLPEPVGLRRTAARVVGRAKAAACSITWS
jgi:hypothetical protein